MTGNIDLKIQLWYGEKITGIHIIRSNTTPTRFILHYSEQFTLRDHKPVRCVTVKNCFIKSAACSYWNLSGPEYWHGRYQEWSPAIQHIRTWFCGDRLHLLFNAVRRWGWTGEIWNVITYPCFATTNTSKCVTLSACYQSSIRYSRLMSVENLNRASVNSATLRKYCTFNKVIGYFTCTAYDLFRLMSSPRRVTKELIIPRNPKKWADNRDIRTTLIIPLSGGMFRYCNERNTMCRFTYMFC
jgi:hypothetical protein